MTAPTGGPAPVPLPPRVRPEPPDRRERRSWTYDALDTLAEARGSRLRERGDSRFSGIYMAVVGVVVLAAMGGSLASSLFARSCTGPVCSAHLQDGALAWLTLGLTALILGGVALAARILGPVGMSAARRSWFGAAPLERPLVVRGPLVGTATSAAVAGLLGGILLALASTGGHPDALTFVTVVLASTCLAVATLFCAALVQTAGGGRAWAALSWALVVVGAVVACLAVAPLPLPVLPGAAPRPVGLVILGVALVGALVAWIVLVRRLGRIPMRELRRAGDATEAATTSVLTLEAAAVDDLRGARARARRGRFTSRPLRGLRERAVVDAELRRLVRSRFPLAVAALLLPVPLLLGGLLGPLAATVGATLCAIVVGNTAATGLRLWTRSSSLRRLYPWPPARVRLAYLAVPTVLVAVWLGIVCAVAGLGVTAWFVLVSVTPLAMLRSAPESSTGIAAGDVALMTSPMGAVPIGLIAVLVRGPDIAAIPVLLLVIGFPALGVALALALLVRRLGEA